MVVLGQPGSDEPVSGSMIGNAAESFAGALPARTSERAMQDRGRGQVERLAAVLQTAGDLALLQEPGSWSKRVAVVSEPCEDLAGVRQALFEGSQRVDGSGQRPSQTIRELVGGARLSHARQQRLDGTVIRGAMLVQVIKS